MSVNDTIIAIATPPGKGAIAIIRIAGSQTVTLLDKIFRPRNIKKNKAATWQGYTIHFGEVVDNDAVLDEVLVSFFRAPHSYTGDDGAEISCHGSTYIQRQILQLLITHGARLAAPGEFTMRAFLNGKLQLTQAEAVADVIASDSKALHRTAMNQLRGGIQHEIQDLRQQLIHFASLLELELDFGEEDVTFVSRKELMNLIEHIKNKIAALLNTFDTGNALREGIPVVIAGAPNAGKSTLLNAIIGEDRAIVSEIAGTTRDTIEEPFFIEGIKFRFIDTAGIRTTTDDIESKGIARTMGKIKTAAIAILLIDGANQPVAQAMEDLQNLKNTLVGSEAVALPVVNKTDQMDESKIAAFASIENIIFISALKRANLESLTTAMVHSHSVSKLQLDNELTINVRHKEALEKTRLALNAATDGFAANLTTDWIAQEIRMALYHLGTVSGEISTDDLLENIFSRFCIGK